ncbi:SDR family NAD(P)-dependent oxidoreductase [Alicyclobacillus tolerans]|uniref:Gluconate 5-dehydrogenase n=2 Tax=Alicyclobacillus tolerans TaxID=90970 RepID=A0ABT9LYV6_9BACL|nr:MULTISPECIES: SDR family oxidoreductase [Alicyclobacillus]MDP9729438.1 gluconate 5-dehydrogenase [Alicyclobacillus tengchongensis]QRF22804.1 SDR family oxidoreductase [Alicyclobacillus sp. TC]SHK22564.1 gluconate 5-dehydrogenase [Alicyclobacillus montanus]
MNLLDGRRIVVTGASSGLGLAMAEALLKAGASVAMTARATDRLDSEVKRLTHAGYDAYSLPMDVRSEQSISDAVSWVVQTWGKIDVLVNNAGIGMRTVNSRFMLEPQPFFEVTPQGFRDVIDTNLTGYFLVSRGFAPLLVRQGYGKVINISMNHSTMRRRGFIPYGPSRAGAESLSYIMAEDLLPYGITVNMLLPGGATETGMIPDEMKKQLKVPLLHPNIMADPIVFLASDQSDGITGERMIATEFANWYKERFGNS